MGIFDFLHHNDSELGRPDNAGQDSESGAGLAVPAPRGPGGVAEPANDLSVEGPDEPEGLRPQVVAALRTVFDPEIPVNIYDLGLIYGLDINVDGEVKIAMTLTAPGCPVAQTFPETVASVVRMVPGVADAWVELVWEPPWSPEMASEVARLELGLY